MSETIISKRCTGCNKIKLLSEFYRNRTSKDGYQCHCKICQRMQKQSEKGKEIQKHYAQSEKGKTARRRTTYKYTQSEKGKANQKRRRKSEKYKVAYQKGLKRYKIHHPERIAARNAVNYAISKGQLSRPDSLQCHDCPAQAQEHHHPGHEPEHWLDVIPVCVKCHKNHNKKRLVATKSIVQPTSFFVE